MNPSNFPIIGYFPSWTGSVEAIPFAKLTQVNYSFVFPAPDGGLTEVDAGKLRTLVHLAHGQGVKVCIAVGGWNDADCGPFEIMASRPETRAAFVRNLTALCDRFDLDGIDIDWEYPKAHSAGNFLLLIEELDHAFRSRGRLFSAAVVAEGDEFGAHIHPGVFAHIDGLNIMAYDWHYQTEGINHSPLSLAQSSLDYWLKRGCPREKAVLGVPFYGRSPTASAAYGELVERDPLAAYKDDMDGMLYNGIPTMRAKTELALDKAGGIMFWELTQDTHGATSLLNAIYGTVQARLAVA